MAQHPKGHRGSDGGATANVDAYQSMPSQMESPLNAQKDSPEEGPQAPGGLPKWPVKDPMGFLEPQGKD